MDRIIPAWGIYVMAAMLLAGVCLDLYTMRKKKY